MGYLFVLPSEINGLSVNSPNAHLDKLTYAISLLIQLNDSFNIECVLSGALAINFITEIASLLSKLKPKQELRDKDVIHSFNLSNAIEFEVNKWKQRCMA